MFDRALTIYLRKQKLAVNISIGIILCHRRFDEMHCVVFRARPSWSFEVCYFVIACERDVWHHGRHACTHAFVTSELSCFMCKRVNKNILLVNKRRKDVSGVQRYGAEDIQGQRGYFPVRLSASQLFCAVSDGDLCFRFLLAMKVKNLAGCFVLGIAVLFCFRTGKVYITNSSRPISSYIVSRFTPYGTTRAPYYFTLGIVEVFRESCVSQKK